MTTISAAETTRIKAPGATIIFQRTFAAGFCKCWYHVKDINFTLTGTDIDSGRICDTCAAGMAAEFLRTHASAAITQDDLILVNRESAA